MAEEAPGDALISGEDMLPQSPLVQPGCVVAGKYELEAMIGHGGMGTVWSARHVNLGQRAAVKFISTAHIDSPDALLRFDREAKAAATIRSRNVVQVFDNGQLEDGTPYMVMEFLEGTSLADRIAAEGSLPLEETLRIIKHVGRALAGAHGMGIVHRDIKPENIFLATSPDEESYIAKVLDFGVAKFITARAAAQARTRTGTIVGTPLYMSPEQVRGLKSIDHRTDVYSLGALAFTMLTGTVVFNGKTFGDLLFQICTDPLPTVTEAAPWLPAAVDAWFAKSCARSPEDRFQTVAEQVDGLAGAVGATMRQTIPDSSAGDAGADPIPRRTSPSLRDSGARVSPAAPTMIASEQPLADSGVKPLRAGGDATLRSATELLAPGKAAATPAGNSKTLLLIVAGILVLVAIAAGAFYLGSRVATKPPQPASASSATP